MNLRDSDLISIQEARQAVERASEAQQKFASFSQTQVDAVVDSCAKAATAAGEQLARLAVEETGYGNVPDKIIKNRLASVDVHRAIRGMKTVGIIREDPERGILEVAEPVGVIAAVIPSTNPTSTAIYKTLISLKARNAIVLSPHPAAMRCICEAASILERAALRSGAPEGLIVCLYHPTLQGTQELMRQRGVGVILATGGAGLVRAAYGSGKPAYGVGPGNVPAFIESTANIRKAVGDIFAGKTFDYGTICSSEQAIVAEKSVFDAVLGECRQQGAYFLTPEEIRGLGELVIVPGVFTPNPKIVGRPATVIAEMAGIKVPASTRVLLAKLDDVGREHPLSGEKLSPILALYSVANLAEGIERCKSLLSFGGLGHTIAIHSQNEAAIREFGQAVPAFRVCVNTSAVHGSIGYSTNLFPAMTLGCGSPGGNITSDNIGPLHLINIKRIAWESRPVEHRTVPAEQRMTAVQASPPESRPLAQAVSADAAAAAPVLARQMIAHIVEEVFAARGIPRRGAAAAASPEPADVACTNASPANAKRVATPPNVGEVHPLDVLRDGEAPLRAPQIRVSDFVSEDDVRSAIWRREKIYIGPRTIVTPSARDLGSSHEIFVETLDPSSGPKTTRLDY